MKYHIYNIKTGKKVSRHFKSLTRAVRRARELDLHNGGLQYITHVVKVAEAKA